MGDCNETEAASLKELREWATAVGAHVAFIARDFGHVKTYAATAHGEVRFCRVVDPTPEPCEWFYAGFQT